MSFAFLAAVILASMPLSARERRGRTVFVSMIDGGEISGELLAVRSDTLLVYDRIAGQGRSIDLRQVAKVKIAKKSKILKGVIIGLVCGYMMTWLDIEGQIHGNTSLLPVPCGGLVGGAIGALAGIPIRFAHHGVASWSLEKDLKKLRSYARERDHDSFARGNKEEP